MIDLAAVLRLTSARVSLAVAMLLAAAMCGVPLLGVHGAESALVLGVVLPVLAALTAARWVRSARASTTVAPDALSVVASAVGYAGSLWAVPIGVLALDALRVRNCAPLEGLTFMVLGPGAGASLGALWGVTAACLCRGARTGTTLALAGPLGAIALALVRFYTTPAIHAFSHFFGYFPGTVYDELSALPSALWTLRVLTVTLCLALCALLAAGLDDALVLKPLRAVRRGSRLWLAVAGVGLGLCALGELYGPELGHRTSEAHIRHTLGKEHRSERCRLVVPSELRLEALRRLADDCDFRVASLERRLGIAEPTPITVFVFRSADERRALMGAHTTNIAKPWLHQIYLEQAGWPHPVLHHELAHVLLGHVGRGPFRIAGALGGLWPDPARIEGAAVAAAFEPRQGMSPHEWSRAMLEVGLLPPLHELVGSGFLGAQQRLAYVVTGSVLRHVLDTRGAATLRRLYASDRLDEAGLGQPLADLERDWHAFLRSQPLSKVALAQARLFFDGGSVFGRVCPHRLADLRDRLAGALSAGDDLLAEQHCREILDIDPGEASTRGRLVGVLTRRGQATAAAQELVTLRGPPAAAPALLLSVRAELADEAWRAGRLDEARAEYRALLREPLDDNAQRLLQAKELVLTPGTDPAQARLAFDLLVGKPGQRTEGVLAEYLIRELSALRSDGLPTYLEGRQLHFAERHAEAATLLASARARGLPGTALPREAIRLEAVSRYALADYLTATRLFTQLSRDDSGATRLEAEDWLARIRHTKRTNAGRP